MNPGTAFPDTNYEHDLIDAIKDMEHIDILNPIEVDGLWTNFKRLIQQLQYTLYGVKYVMNNLCKAEIL